VRPTETVVDERLEIYIDGASKGNPGHSGVGIIICHNQRVLRNISRYIGTATNNVAEYTALIYSLEEALLMKAKRLLIKTDSELLYRQIKKEYKVRHPAILALYNQALRLMQGFHKVDVMHIPREENSGADKLASSAAKKHAKE